MAGLVLADNTRFKPWATEAHTVEPIAIVTQFQYWLVGNREIPWYWE
jgi:hypothetical protein